MKMYIMGLIFLFLDGVGLASAGPDNRLTTADMPALQALLGGPLVASSAQARGLLLLKGIDATLGVAGPPQSGTGQTALLAGFNASELHGRHQPHFPPVALRPLLAERSVLRRVVLRGGRATFANAFGPGYWDALATRRIRRSASVIANEGAGLRFRDLEDLRAGRALAWDVTGASMHEREPDASLPLFTPQQAGANLAQLAAEHELVFYENFLPDLAGHGRLSVADRPPTTDHRPPSEEQRTKNTEQTPNANTLYGGLSVAAPTPNNGRSGPSVATPTTDNDQRTDNQIYFAMRLIDGLIGGVLAALRPSDTLLISSDHGNVESRAAPAHTRNPVPLLVVGPAAELFVGVESIVDVADAIMLATGLPE
jgi:2,3-bisphosphoglycerate-independent phosphoglycerate mutase